MAILIAAIMAMRDWLPDPIRIACVVFMACVLIGGFLYSIWNWRCPACGKILLKYNQCSAVKSCRKGNIKHYPYSLVLSIKTPYGEISQTPIKCTLLHSFELEMRLCFS
jgi:hypothetical protein